ncbi:hypothetical protein [Paenibacillus kobensis]|uniref:hypothetical protein n=1 Tax=Paenibacillus kobensis TaxID=59841 RepID=UPI0013E2C9DD|nr:hypothetical protein [Paenibacillus kobensis]
MDDQLVILLLVLVAAFCLFMSFTLSGYIGRKKQFEKQLIDKLDEITQLIKKTKD